MLKRRRPETASQASAARDALLSQLDSTRLAPSVRPLSSNLGLSTLALTISLFLSLSRLVSSPAGQPSCLLTKYEY